MTVSIHNLLKTCLQAVCVNKKTEETKLLFDVLTHMTLSIGRSRLLELLSVRAFRFIIGTGTKIRQARFDQGDKTSFRDACLFTVAIIF